MFTNYLKIAWRNILKNKGYTFINILGLAIGLAACLLIALYVHHELSFDRYHANAGRVYRADIEIKFGDNHIDLALTNPLFGEAAIKELPTVEKFARLKWYGGFLIKKGNENIRESQVGWADNALFEIFSFPFISGDPKSALTDPNTIVISESIARKYFNETNVAGRMLFINNKDQRKITGVIKDIPPNSHIQFKMFIPLIEDEGAKDPTWAGSQNYTTYVLTKPNTEPTILTRQLNDLLDRNLGVELKTLLNKSLSEFNAQGDYFKVSLTALTDIHLHSDKIGELFDSGNIQYVYIFSAIAIFILIIACINFMNLATARASKRAREVGVRKVLGSLKHTLIYQFLTEAIVTTTLAMMSALLIAKGFLKAFNKLASTEITLDLLFTPTTFLLMGGIIIIVGILAGLYPSFYLSAFQPVDVLKGSLGGNLNKSLFRNALVVFQFMTSVVLITGTLIIYRQLDFIRKKDIGYNREQLLIINNTDQIGNRLNSFKNELLEIPGIQHVTASGFLPVNYYRSNESFFPNTSLDTKEAISMQEWQVDENYIPTLGMKIIEGRNFSKAMGTDSMAIIINEAAARFMGNKDILNKKFYNFKDEHTKTLNEYHIVGIVKDFNFTSLREHVKPLAFVFQQNNASLTAKVSATDVSDVLKQIKEKWSQIIPDLPFEYSFMDQDYDQYYKGERKIGQLFTVFALLAIFLACLGLFGLTTFIAEQRTKEIGIRKVLGATVSGVTTLLSKDFLRLVLIAILVAIPISYFLMNKWLQAFAYKIDLEWWMFALAGVLSIGIAVMTISYQAIRAALANPVKSLRTE